MSDAVGAWKITVPRPTVVLTVPAAPEHASSVMGDALSAQGYAVRSVGPLAAEVTRTHWWSLASGVLPEKERLTLETVPGTGVRLSYVRGADASGAPARVVAALRATVHRLRAEGHTVSVGPWESGLSSGR
ncbi:hypothetical protein Cch01nite_28570 [Cellulomonas chitinilytica]|uniref:Uncharacterized protein n=1 Tax=Cellulomonas chitinilytica TaxID=398759 RepID=A0A919U0M3_9CELL|nr:hypothetical protein [Cellulomonas chitinilytica]GIG22133.1 hypothetical protein Cch01nite_28570 [Cellulomonas chitinilytica]